MSRRVLFEYDCKDERSRVLSFSTHSEAMAGGKALSTYSSGPSKWDYIAPGTSGQTNLRIVCAK